MKLDWLKTLLHYDPDLGWFMWLRDSGRCRAGDVAGQVDKHGYIQIGVSGKRYPAHRLAWLWMTGAWPKAQVDHRDRNRQHNRFENLREATSGQNRQNQGLRSDNKSGRKGVYWSSKKQRFIAFITDNYRRISLGSFENLIDAVACRLAAERRFFTHHQEA